MTNPRHLTQRLDKLHGPADAALELATLRLLRDRNLDELPADRREADRVLRYARHAINAGFPAGGDARGLTAALNRHPAFDECPTVDPKLLGLLAEIVSTTTAHVFE